MSKGRNSPSSSLKKLKSYTSLINYGNSQMDTPVLPSSSSSQESADNSHLNSNPSENINADRSTESTRESIKPFNIEVVNDKTRSGSWSFWKNDTKQARARSQSPSITTDACESSSNSQRAIKDTEDLNINREPVLKKVKLKSSNNSIRSNNSDDKYKDKDESWLNWRRLSKESISNFIYSDASYAQSTSSQLAPDEPKSIVTHDDSSGAPDFKTSKQQQSQPWSFWNSTNSDPSAISDPSNKSRPPLTNTIFSSKDAVLFEPHESEEVESTININKNKNLKANIIVPSLEQCLPSYSTTSSIYTNIHRLTHKLGISQSDPKYLYRIKSTPVRNVLIIGVHGFFPTKVLRPLIGEPTGTSFRFANEAERAVLRYAKEQKWEHVSIQKIALEREGKVFDRVDFFYDIMVKWIDEINKADFIFIAAHSQGCPVSILLLAKLIENGYIDSNKKIGILAMAGINNGPFYGVDQKFFVKAYSTIENLSMMELFEFQNFSSLQSKRYLESIRIVIRHNVKISFIGSINDQLVPLYSSTCSHVKHPNIFRATYIDGSSGTPDFVTRLVDIANHLNNIGSTDHGIIKEVSGILAGPLTGGGHSKIYNDGKVYDMGIRFALNTNDLIYDLPVKFKEFDISKLGSNPYHLPWCMRGLMFESVNFLPNGEEEISKLFEEFEKWKPDSKPLKDMKYRLNAIKAKL